MLLVILLLLFASAALGGVLAVLLRSEPEEGLFWKGMGYALLGNFLITIGPWPIPVTQIIGALMAANADINRLSRWAAFGLGLAFRVLGFFLG